MCTGEANELGEGSWIITFFRLFLMNRSLLTVWLWTRTVVPMNPHRARRWSSSNTSFRSQRSPVWELYGNFDSGLVWESPLALLMAILAAMQTLRFSLIWTNSDHFDVPYSLIEADKWRLSDFILKLLGSFSMWFFSEMLRSPIWKCYPWNCSLNSFSIFYQSRKFIIIFFMKILSDKKKASSTVLLQK